MIFIELGSTLLVYLYTRMHNVIKEARHDMFRQANPTYVVVMWTYVNTGWNIYTVGLSHGAKSGWIIKTNFLNADF